MKKDIYRGPKTSFTTILVGVHLEGWEGKHIFKFNISVFQAVLTLQPFIVNLFSVRRNSQSDCGFLLPSPEWEQSLQHVDDLDVDLQSGALPFTNGVKKTL